MFYEEQVIDGTLWCRSQPDGPWRPATTPHSAAVNALLALTDEQRGDATRWFCSHCGCVQPDGRMCQCWNDAQRGANRAPRAEVAATVNVVLYDRLMKSSRVKDSQ